MTKTIEQKIADKEAQIKSLRAEYKSIQGKISRGVDTLKKLVQERDADKLDAVWNETNPAKVDWEFFLADGPSSPYVVDYRRAQKKLAVLMGLDEDRYYLVDKSRMVDRSYKNMYMTFQIRLLDSRKQSREQSIAEFKNMLAITTVAVRPLSAAAHVFSEGAQPDDGKEIENIGDYIQVNLMDGNSEYGIPWLLFKPDMSSFIFMLTRYSRNYIEYQTDSLDDLIQWMYNNGKTYSW